MERVQAALKEQLARQNDKLRIDLKKQVMPMFRGIICSLYPLVARNGQKCSERKREAWSSAV